MRMKLENGLEVPMSAVEEAEFDAMDAAAEVAQFEKLRADKIAEIDAAYNAVITGDVMYMGYQFQADDASQLLLLKATANGGRKWAGFWQDRSNVMRTMTYEEGLGLFDAMADLVPSAFLNQQAKKQAARDAVTIQQLEAITWN